MQENDSEARSEVKKQEFHVIKCTRITRKEKSPIAGSYGLGVIFPNAVCTWLKVQNGNHCSLPCLRTKSLAPPQTLCPFSSNIHYLHRSAGPSTYFCLISRRDLRIMGVNYFTNCARDDGVAPTVTLLHFHS